MNDNDPDPAASDAGSSPPVETSSHDSGAPAQGGGDAHGEGSSEHSSEAGTTNVATEGGAAAGPGEGGGGDDAGGPGGKRERRRKKGRGERQGQGPGGNQGGGPGGGPGGGSHRGQGGGGGGGGHGPQHGGAPLRYVEDRIDVDAEHLARDTRSIPPHRVRPLALLTAQMRRLLASPDAHDRREARRTLVLFRSRIAFLAGRESGRERNQFVRLRDFVLRGIEQVTRDREYLDPLQVRNFLDQVDAYVGYHRFHCDDRRRD